MKTEHLLTSSVRALRRHRLRTGFIMLASLAGIAALTFVLSVGQGAQRKMLKTVRQIFGDSGILVGAGPHQMMGGPRADAVRLTLDDVEAIARAYPEIETWDPQLSTMASVRHSDAAATIRVLGESERFERVWSRGVTRGAIFDATAVKRGDRVALIGETVARKLFGPTDPVGAEILVNSVPFSVVGILEPFGTDLHGMDRDNEVVVPITTLMRRVMNVDKIAAAKLVITDSGRIPTVAAGMRELLRARHGLMPGQPDDFSVITPVEVQQMVGKMRRILSLYLPLASIVVLVVGGIVATTLMLSSVNARVAEIGLCRAVGAEPRDIARQFLVEATLTMLGGGVAGVALGLAAAEALAMHINLGPVFAWTSIPIGLLLAGMVGVLAGVVPARRAARLFPAEALR